MKEIKTFLGTFLCMLTVMVSTVNCNAPKYKNDMGTVERLPNGNYTIWNIGSRHMVKCLKDDGKVYWLNDANFNQNGIDGYDAHQYINKTQITIK